MSCSGHERHSSTVLLSFPQAVAATAEREHQAAVAAAQHHGRSPLQEPLWMYNEAGGAARGQRGPFSLLSLLAMMQGARRDCVCLLARPKSVSA